jgi:fermentation-respiration switch protein FrsA (DUF1100 family)
MYENKGITREDIAEIYEQRGYISMRDAQKKVQDNPDRASMDLLEEAFALYDTADEIRKVDQLKPLVRIKGVLVRAETNVW